MLLQTQSKRPVFDAALHREPMRAAVRFGIGSAHGNAPILPGRYSLLDTCQRRATGGTPQGEPCIGSANPS